MDSPAPEPRPLEGRRLGLASIAISLATFMNVLDSSIANVSIPTISGDFGVSPNQGTWVITSFAVANAISVPLTGWLTQRFGQVRLFTASVVLFVLASLLCGLSVNLEMLIVARVLQGAVAGPMIPLSQTLLMTIYPKAKSGLGLAIWAMTTMTAPVMGPIVGGWLSDNWSWPWIFYINIPTGLVAAWLSWNLLQEHESRALKLPIDVIGLVMLVVWVGALQIMIDTGKELDWFNSTQIIALALISVVTFALFIVWELNEEHPIVDLRLFAGRNFTIGVLTLAIGYGMFFSNVVLLPLWLQQYMGYTATWSGLVSAPVGVFALLISPIVGKNIHRWDARLLTSVSFLVFGLVSYLRMGYSTDHDTWHVLLPQLIQGVAMATFFVPLTALFLAGLPANKVADASGLASFARMTCGALGASLITTLWEGRAAHHHTLLMERVTPYDSAMQGTLGVAEQLGLQGRAALALIERQITVQSYTLGANDMFFASGVLIISLIPLVWLAHSNTRFNPAGASDAGAH